jgi:dihydrofolate reductase
MSRFKFNITMSLDGYVAGPRQSVENPPFHTPVFVLTHHPRKPLEMQGATIFHFVTQGIHAALDQAKKAARGKDVV